MLFTDSRFGEDKGSTQIADFRSECYFVKRSRVLLFVARLVDILSIPLTLVAAIWLKGLRILGLKHVPLTKNLLISLGVLPIRDHYYEPLFNPRHLRHSLALDRSLPSVDLNFKEQLTLLSRFSYQNELAEIPKFKINPFEYYYNNASFESGDAEYLYSLIRLFKPKRFFEIGSGFSTLMARKALLKNFADDSTYSCEHVCIEPYEQPWLEELGIQIIRKRVEDCDIGMFSCLQRGDFLFIDSSHIVRPQGDVLFEFFEILPALNSGVLVHVHDIFTPRDYLEEWVVDDMKLWNEQYLLEAFLAFNSEFRVIGALNYLTHNFPVEVGEKLPVLKAEMATREPGSFWMVRQ